jgi:hemoglobin
MPKPASGQSLERRERDLTTRADVHEVVVTFYREIVFDPLLGPVFEEVAEVDWATHIPKLVDFWCRVLLGEPGYDGTVLRAHRGVHDAEAFRLEHFDRWYELWAESIDQGWAGPHAEEAKVHAARIANVLASRLLGADWAPPERGVRAR